MGAYAGAGFYYLVHLLLDFGADINGTNDDGDTPLHLACDKGHLDIVDLLVAEGASLSQLNNCNEIPLVKAAKNNHTDIISQLIELEENLFSPMEKVAVFKEALIVGCAFNHFDVVDMCAEFVNDLDFQESQTGETPLTASSKNGHHAIVQSLILEGGANPDLANDKGVPPLILAAKEQHHRVIEALVEGGASLNGTDFQSKTALMYAAKQNDLISLEYLIKKEADLKLRDKDGICALGWACLRSNTDAVELLLESGENVEVNGVDNLGRTPLDLAAFTGAEEIVTVRLV